MKGQRTEASKKVEDKKEVSPKTVTEKLKILQKPAEEITGVELEELATWFLELDKAAKELNKTLGEIKAHIARAAQVGDWREWEFDQIKIRATYSMLTSIDPYDLGKLLSKEGKQSLFPKVFNVKISEAKKLLGEEALSEIMEVREAEKPSISIKEK